MSLLTPLIISLNDSVNMCVNEIIVNNKTFFFFQLGHYVPLQHKENDALCTETDLCCRCLVQPKGCWSGCRMSPIHVFVLVR